MKPINHFEVGRVYNGKVVKILDFGAVIEFTFDGQAVTELLHISNMKDGFVKDIQDVVKVGDFVDVIAIEGSVKPVELSMKPSSFEQFS